MRVPSRIGGSSISRASHSTSSWTRPTPIWCLRDGAHLQSVSSDRLADVDAGHGAGIFGPAVFHRRAAGDVSFATASSASSDGQIDHALTLANYVRFFTDPIFLPVFWNTCVLCLSVALICVILAYPVAYLLASLQGRWRYALLCC